MTDKSPSGNSKGEAVHCETTVETVSCETAIETVRGKTAVETVHGETAIKTPVRCETAGRTVRGETAVQTLMPAFKYHYKVRSYWDVPVTIKLIYYCPEAKKLLPLDGLAEIESNVRRTMRKEDLFKEFNRYEYSKSLLETFFSMSVPESVENIYLHYGTRYDEGRTYVVTDAGVWYLDAIGVWQDDSGVKCWRVPMVCLVMNAEKAIQGNEALKGLL